jgi:hypothetical protein
MGTLETSEDRRKFIRYKVNKDAFAVIRTSDNKLGRIKDVSKGGLSFEYIMKGDPSEGITELDIFTTENDFYLKLLPVQIIKDSTMESEHAFSSLEMRRLGVQFGEMTPNQMSKLDYFLQHHTSAGTVQA